MQTLTEYLDDAEAFGDESSAGFDLPDPEPETHDLFVANAEFSTAMRWIISRRHSGKHQYLGYGDDRRYIDCCIFGCPETVRRDCVLEREMVIAFSGMLPNVHNLESPWHWVSSDAMYRDVR